MKKNTLWKFDGTRSLIVKTTRLLPRFVGGFFGLFEAVFWFDLEGLARCFVVVGFFCEMMISQQEAEM